MLVYFTLVPLSPNALSQVDDSKTPFIFLHPKGMSSSALI